MFIYFYYFHLLFFLFIADHVEYIFPILKLLFMCDLFSPFLFFAPFISSFFSPLQAI